MFQIIGAMAEFERAPIQERVKAGLRNAKAEGKHIGRHAWRWSIPECSNFELMAFLDKYHFRST
jgi:DNA invertase Pin-like site-specific DNA recombinase